MDDRELRRRVGAHLSVLYPGTEPGLVERVIAAIGPAAAGRPAPRWSEDDVVCITYADTLTDGDRRPLGVLTEFVCDHLAEAVSVVHVLPFFPSSSDRGFAVIDHTAVEPAFGTWSDIDRLARRVGLMVDLVCNHTSSRCAWFEQFLVGAPPGNAYYHAVAPGADLSMVVRPRAGSPLHVHDTADGPVVVWSTFSADQPDLDYRNPHVLLEILAVVDVLLRHGARFIRLDAVAYVGKQIGTPSIHLPEAHELVRLLRTLLEWRAPSAVVVTETNVPDAENRSYLGVGDEAHAIYNFTLPPLVLHALTSATTEHLTRWLAATPPLPPGCTVLNFLASHDGVGLRPVEALLPDAEIDRLVDATVAAGGRCSVYAAPSGERPYELNVSLWDQLGAHADRFVAAHTVMFALAGIPAVYLPSFLAMASDVNGAAVSGIARDLNRGRVALADADTTTVLPELRRRLAIRRDQAAFHPEADQEVVDLGPAVVALQRTSIDRAQRILAVHNLTAERTSVDLPGPAGPWFDLLGSDPATPISGSDPSLELAPYQAAWLELA